MTQSGIFIGVDVGTSGTKAIAIDQNGTRLATAFREYPLSSPKPNWAEQDPAHWRKAALDVLAELSSKIDSKRVAAIGLTGQMHGSVFLDAKNQVLRPALLWCDQRTSAQCDYITEKAGGEAALVALVGSPALTGFTAPKILWLRDHEPELFEKTRKVLLPKDYIRWVLTGEYATDVADASGTLLFDVKQRKWHQGLMTLLDLDPDLMPPAYEGPEITGKLSPNIAEEVGLPAGTIVVAGGGDQAAGGVGCGIVRTGAVSSALGTSGVVFAFSNEVQYDPKGRVHTFCHAVPGKWHVMGVMLSAGGALQWYRNQLCFEELEAAKQNNRDVYDIITEEAEKIPCGAEGLLFLPYLTGERAPHRDPYAKAAFLGLSLRHTKAHMARAVLEGVAFGMRDSLDIMREMGIPLEVSRVSGGGAKSALWRQIMADTGRIEIAQINVDEGPAFGAAILAGVGAKAFSSVEEACDAMIRETNRISIIEENAAKYDAYLREFRLAYLGLKERFESLAKLLD
ncbi:MAG: xylulokinase [Candidatus Hydrogenedentes bacterium]|nr:xylulokinase [Candidatus Hydrogenedentota bacterium]